MSETPEINPSAVAIVGMAARLPGAASVEDFWRNLVQGAEAIQTFAPEALEHCLAKNDPANADRYVRARSVLENADQFDAAFFGIYPRQAELMDPQHRVFLECAWEALESAGYDPETYPGLIGLYAGLSLNTYLLYNISSQPGAAPALAASYPGSYDTLFGNDKDFMTTRVAHKLNLRGPCVTVQTACSTSLVAVAHAYYSLLTYQCDMALAGGVSITFPQRRDYLYEAEGMVSRDGTCRSFDAESSGTVFGSGAGIVVLKRLSEAIADGDHIRAVILGAAVNNDGSARVGYAAPGVQGQAAVIALAQAAAGVTADSISYVEAHGTGTPMGDPIEVAALTQAFRQTTARKGFCRLGTAKTHVGHLDMASGVTGLIKTVLQLEHEKIPALLHFQRPNPRIDFENSPFVPVATLTEWPRTAVPRRAGVSAFGVGGTNAHVIVEEAPLPEPRVTSRARQVLVLSAKTPTALETMTRNLADWLEQQSSVLPPLRVGERAGVRCPDPNLPSPLSNALLADVAFTLQLGRKPFAHRRAVVVSGPEEAVKALRALEAKTSATGQAPAQEPEVVFLFPGQGAQYVDMGRELYAKEPVFREEMDRCAEILRTHLGTDIRTILHPTAEGRADASTRINETAMTQPAIFVIEYALAKLWQSWGVQPSILIGHSIGEYVCAVLAETFTLEDALALLAVRAKLMQALPAGSMLAVRLPGAEVEPLLPAGVFIAAYNSAKLCTVSGPTEVLERFQQELEGRKVAAKLLPTSHAFHSAMMDPMLEEFTAAVAKTPRSAPKQRWISTCTGTWMTPEDLADPAYWSRQLRQAVRFADALSLVAGDRKHLLLEVGPGQALTQLARQHPGKPPELVVLSSFGPGSEAGEEVASMYGALGRLWIAGVTPRWDRLHAGERRRRVPLPTYPFERKRFWVEPAAQTSASAIPNLMQAACGVMALAGPAPLPAPILMNNLPDVPSPVVPRRPRLAAEVSATFEDLSGLQLTSDSVSFLELGFDSLFLTQASQALQKRFGVKITFRQLINDLNTVEALAGHLDAVLPPDKAPAPVMQAQSVSLAPAAATSPSAPMAMPLLTPAIGAAGMQQLLAQQTLLLQQQLALLQAFGAGAPAGAGTAALPSTVPVVAPSSVPVATTIAAAPAGADSPAAKAFGSLKDLDRAADVSLTSKQRQYLDELVARYTKRTAGSKAHTQKYRQWYADPRTASGFNRLWKEMVYQIVVTKSSGSRLWDVDDNEYIDLLNGFGPGFLGHSPDFITKALKEQLDKGVEVGPQSLLAGEAAKLFCELTGNERASFVCTGSEAVYAAMRLARTVTGRDKIVVFTKDYHGNFDEVLVRAVGTPPQLRSMPIAPGIPFRAVSDMVVLDYGTDAALDYIKAHADEIAGVLIEPVQSRRPEWRPVEFIQELRRLTSEHGALLIFDEVVTGLRSGPGGAQAYYGVKADLATYGKVVGGGMPIGMVAGKAEYMDTFDGGMWQYGDDSFPGKGVTFFAGTFVRHPLAIAAVHEVLKHLHAQGPEFWETLNRRAERLATTLDAFFVERGIPIRVPHFKSFMFVRMGEDQKYGNLLFYRLREKGIFLLENFPSYLTVAHSDADIDRVITAFQESALELVAAGFLPGTLTPGPSAPTDRSGTTVSSPGREGVASAQSSPTANGLRSPAPVVVGSATALAGNRFPLTDGQQEMSVAAQMTPEASGTHNASNVLTLRGPLDVEGLTRAIDAVIARHESLRSTFSPDGAEIVVADRLSFPLTVRDLSDVAGGPKESRVAAILEEEGRRLFDLVNGPLFSFQLLRFSDAEHQLIFTVQMIVCDGWAYNLVLEDVGTIYSALVRGNEPSLAPAIPMRDYVQWQRQPERAVEVAECEAFWLARFQTLPPPLDLPLTGTRPPQRTFAGDRQSLRLGRDLFQSLKGAAKQMKATPFSVLLTAYYTWLSRLGGQTDLVVGVPFAGQGGAGLEGLVGQCVHTLPLRVTVDSTAPFTWLLRQTQEAFLDAQEKWNYGFGRLVQKLDVPRDPSRIPLVSVIFNLDVPMDRIRFDGCQIEIAAAPRYYFQYDLGFNLVDEGATLLVECDYNRNLFDGPTIRGWLTHFQTLLEGIIAQPDCEVGLLPLHPASQRTTWRRENWKESPAQHGVLHEMFAAQAKRSPDRVAVEFGVETLTYGELDLRSNQVANLLRSLGVTSEAVVGVCTKRGFDMVVAVLAVLKAGGAYLSIDPQLPVARMEAIMEDAGAKVVLTHGAFLQQLPAQNLRVICLDEDRDAIARESTELTPAPVRPDHLAYLMFTSGSTGRPKGVEVTHEAVVNFLMAMRDEPGLGPEDVVLALTTLSFDISVLELFLPLVTGAKTVVVTREILIDPHQLEEVIDRHGITVMQATPATWRMLFNAGWKGKPKLKVLCGGEALLPDLAARLLGSCGEVWNMYGPTETTVWSMVERIRSHDSITLGRPIANTWVGVVDERRQPVAVGVAGELLIGGAGVARGYRKLPELTRERFIEDPFREPAADSRWPRCYRTGDLVRFRADGAMEFVGRRDHQVKLRGHRVELGEIETVLVSHERVRDAAVLLREDAGQQPALVAYLVTATPKAGAALAEFRAELRQWLRARLPDYMVPAAFVCIEQVPRTPEGKKDRAALPPPGKDAYDAGESFIPARSVIEKSLARLWSEILKIEKIGIRQSFFELGGQSLMAVALFAKIEKEFGRRLPLATLLRAPTIEQLAAELEGKTDAAATHWTSLVPVQPKGTRPALFLVHGAGGNVLLYRALAEHLAPEYPIYGLQSRGLDGASAPLTSIEEMAVEYLKEIRTVQPSGPYHLGGYCLGGTVAYEMAQLLRQAGEEVALVAMLDTYNFSRALKVSFASFLQQKVKFHLGNFLRLRPRDMVQYLGEKIRIARDGELANLLTSRPGSAPAHPGDGVARAESGIEASVQAINDAAADGYLPKPYPGRIALFKPQVNYKFYPDPKMGWGDLALGGLDMVEMPLNPHAMLVEPYVRTLALELKKRMTRPAVALAELNRHTLSPEQASRAV